MYLVGRYIGKHYQSSENGFRLWTSGSTKGERLISTLHKPLQNLSVVRLRVSLVIVLSIGIALNCVTGYLFPRDGLPYAPFAKDSSIITFTLSILIFLLVVRHSFSSVIVNRIAMHTIAIYLFEHTLEFITLYDSGLWDYKGNWYYIVLLIVCAIIISIGCCLIDEIRYVLFIPIEHIIKIIERKIKSFDRQRD